MKTFRLLSNNLFNTCLEAVLTKRNYALYIYYFFKHLIQVYQRNSGPCTTQHISRGYIKNSTKNFPSLPCWNAGLDFLRHWATSREASLPLISPSVLLLLLLLLSLLLLSSFSSSSSSFVIISPSFSAFQSGDQCPQRQLCCSWKCDFPSLTTLGSTWCRFPRTTPGSRAVQMILGLHSLLFIFDNHRPPSPPAFSTGCITTVSFLFSRGVRCTLHLGGSRSATRSSAHVVSVIRLKVVYTS